MSNVNCCTVHLDCNAYADDNPLGYMWFVEISLVNYNAKRAAVAAQIAAGAPVTGYAAITNLGSVCIGEFTFPQHVWCFVVAMDYDNNYTLASDFVEKDVAAD
jgi:hypothetical protein